MIRLIFLALCSTAWASSVTVYDLRLDDSVASLAAAPHAPKKIAVVDFLEESQRQRLPLSDMLEEDLATRLTQDGNFQVILRSRTRDVIDELKLGDSGLTDPQQRKSFGKLAQADALLTGTYLLSGKSVSVNLTLIDVESGQSRWAEHFKIPLGDLPPDALNPPNQYQETEQGGAKLNIRTRPSGAQIIFDSKVLGLSPASIANVRPGTRQVTIVLPGYEIFTRSLDLAAGSVKTLDFDLQAESATWIFKTGPVSARITVDGKDWGDSPVSLQLKTGRHLLSARAAGFKPYEDQIIVSSKEVATKHIALEEKEGSLLLTVSPSPANVFLDGLPVGAANPTLALDGVSAGEHQLKIKKNGFAQDAESAVVHGDQTSVVKVVLQSGDDDWETQFERKRKEREGQ